MSDEADPPRLSKSGASSSERRLAGLVEASRADVGTPEMLALVEARLLPFIGPAQPPVPHLGPAPHAGPPPAAAGSAASAPTGTAASAIGASAAVKVTVAAVIGVAAATGMWMYSTHSRAPAPVPASSAERAAAAPEQAPVPPEQTAATAENPASPTVEGVAPGEPPGVAPSTGAAPSPSNPSGAARAAAAPSEADLVGAAQAALAGNPARALSLCDRHRQLYPSGVLAQEREVLAIEALSAMGRRAQAASRGDRFLKQFPGSAHKSKIEAIVGLR